MLLGLCCAGTSASVVVSLGCTFYAVTAELLCDVDAPFTCTNGTGTPSCKMAPLHQCMHICLCRGGCKWNQHKLTRLLHSGSKIMPLLDSRRPRAQLRLLASASVLGVSASLWKMLSPSMPKQRTYAEKGFTHGL